MKKTFNLPALFVCIGFVIFVIGATFEINPMVFCGMGVFFGAFIVAHFWFTKHKRK